MSAGRDQKMKAAGLQDVVWRSCGPFRPEAETIEFSLESACGAALRFRVAVGSARLMYAALGNALYGDAGVQSEISSGMAIVDGSPHDGQKVCPLASS